jgi:hypothetical protein
MTDREALLAIKGIVDAQLAGEPAPTPTPAPAPTPAPTPTPDPADPCAGITDPKFNEALAEGLDPAGFFWRLGRPLTAQEFACVRARGLPGFDDPTSRPAAPSPVARSGFVLALRGVTLRNKLLGGVTYRFTVPGTAQGEHVQVQIGENASTNHGDVKSEVRGPTGEILSGPVDHGSVFFMHSVVSPGGTLSFYLTPSVDTSLSVMRN